MKTHIYRPLGNCQICEEHGELWSILFVKISGNTEMHLCKRCYDAENEAYYQQRMQRYTQRTLDEIKKRRRDEDKQ